MASPGMSPELAQAIVASARRLGVDPVDLGTSISYETGGKFSPSVWGGAGGNHLGLIQFGPEERKKYGVHEGQSGPEQMQAVENFLRDRGVKPGMGLPDIYSTINAGSPGRYNASDANNGGAPGTVMDKVTKQMGPHMNNARTLLGMNPMAPPAVGALPMADPNMPGAPPGAALPAMDPNAPGSQVFPGGRLDLMTPQPPGAPIDMMASIGPGGGGQSLQGLFGQLGGNLNPAAAGQPAQAAPAQDAPLTLAPMQMAQPVGQGPAMALAAAMQRMRGV